MTTRTQTPRSMTLDQIEAAARSHWPDGAAECPNCSGSGEVTHGYPNGMPLTDRCTICFGRGYVACGTCSDTGYWEEYDAEHGEYAGLYPCDCTTGKRMAELDRIDAEKDAYERPRVIELTDWHNANTAAGNPPY